MAIIRNTSYTNFVKISQMVMKISRFFNISTNMCHQAKFHQNRPNGFADITILDFQDGRHPLC